MPELPEVEVTRRSFASAIAGAEVLSASMGKPLRWPLGCALQVLHGQQIVSVGRRGKYLLVHLSGGVLLIHLGMSGSLRFARIPTPLGPHEHFELVTSQGTLRLHDPRRFGAVVYGKSVTAPSVEKLLRYLGAEPLSEGFVLHEFKRSLRQSRANIKQLLLGGRVVVGVGNIYASEVLFQAGISPFAIAANIDPRQIRRLYEAIRKTLARAVEAGGTTLRDFSNASGMAGHFQNETQVYGRLGQPCFACGTTIALVRQGQRSTYYCPVCQQA